MRYIQRDVAGKVVAHFAHPHPHCEEVADDHPDLLAWDAEREALRRQPSPLEQRLATLEARVDALEASRRDE